MIPCENCSLASCQYRRKPYKHALQRIEDVSKLQPGYGTTNLQTASGKQDIEYIFNGRALRKWARERLHLEHLESGLIQAKFQYAGTTCSNLGRQFDFEYDIQLKPSTDGYQVASADCQPASGDTGHTSMCQYIKNPEKLMGAIKNDTPFLGKILPEILSQKEQFTPSGCYCSPLNRQHKWRLVLEVIHFALAQETNQENNQQKPEAI